MKYTSAEIAKEIFNSSLNMVDVILYDGTLMVPVKMTLDKWEKWAITPA